MAKKVLVVDDDELIRDLLNAFLIMEGYEVILASSGEEAVESAERECPQVILLDIAIPEVGGIEVIKTLKAKEETRSIPVMVVTGIGDSYTEAIPAGADDFIDKPFDLEDLSRRVRRFFVSNI